MNPAMAQSIDVMKDAVLRILQSNAPSLYLCGSITRDDFRPGWSDIDFLCLAGMPITDSQAHELLPLRQELQARYRDNPYFRLFEGGFLNLDAFIHHTADTVVYWGTSGQRVTDTYDFDSFSLYELLTHGMLLCGDEIRGRLTMPVYEDLRADVIRHYETIRKYGANTGRSLYSVGWLLDIARGLYTLRTGKVIAKTKAGEWALENHLCPVPEALELAVRVRRNPQKYMKDEDFWQWTQTLGEKVQLFADCLESEINGSR